jgi:hypothetical protein
LVARAQEVKDAHLTYINIPIDGPASLSKARADQLWQVLSQAKGGVLVHCVTGNRCGAMLALTEAWCQHRDVEEAIAFGKQAGLSTMEPAVRELLAQKSRRSGDTENKSRRSGDTENKSRRSGDTENKSRRSGDTENK